MSTYESKISAAQTRVVEAVGRWVRRDPGYQPGEIRRLFHEYEQVALLVPAQRPRRPRTPLTSQFAAAAMHDHAARIAARMLRVMYDDRQQRFTVDELEQAMRLRHQTASAEMSHLRAEGWVTPTGATRPTRSGYPAEVYRLTDRGAELLREAAGGLLATNDGRAV